MENINTHTETINNVNDIVVIESQEGPRTVDSYPTCLSDVAIYWVDLNTRDSSIFVFPKKIIFSRAKHDLRFCNNPGHKKEEILCVIVRCFLGESARSREQK